MARRSADSITNGKTPDSGHHNSGVAHGSRRSDRFLAGLEKAASVTFLSHVHPDPDSLGAMMGLAHLIETCLHKPTQLTRDGLISRAENRTMVEMLGIDMKPIEELEWHE